MRERGQRARNVPIIVLWRAERLFFSGKNIFFFTTCGTSTPWRSLLSYFPSWSNLPPSRFLHLSNLAHVHFTDVSLLTFFFPRGVCSSLSQHVTSHLELWPPWICQDSGVTVILSPSERTSEPAQSQLTETSKRRQVSHRGHKHPFDLSAIQIEACSHNQWIKWNEFNMAKSMVGWWNVPGFPLRQETWAAGWSVTGKNLAFTSGWKHICVYMQP